jgi:hypothetical protein
VEELSGSGRIRASDTERERLARFLAAAFAEGRLDVAEYDTRVAAAYAAVYRDELIPLIKDLPAPDRPLFDLKSPSLDGLPTPAGAPPPGQALAHNRRRPYGWPVALIMFGGALCLARLGMMTPVTGLMLLLGLAISLSWISDDANWRRRP